MEAPKPTLLTGYLEQLGVPDRIVDSRVPLHGLQFKVHHLLVTLSNLLYLSKSQCPHLTTKIITVLISQGWRKDEMRS